ncbi:Rho-binding antiterminator [Lacimicrobium sp. SS2-24]|uniref:Rho-binding antiterminator n=1 Tax=Lacimicrobium sp. SS2-24 TaxID=2005569 RepID=UPI000B4A9335|nr:Rho-binding antiterminator [Lacimicrobium sp. SS2-24]
MTKPIIACAVHDYIEVACLYGYRLELHLNNGSKVSGSAHTTQTLKGEGEFLCLVDPEQRIALLTILHIRALTPNPYFDAISLYEEGQDRQ